jgi:hypothetical protein
VGCPVKAGMSRRKHVPSLLECGEVSDHQNCTQQGHARVNEDLHGLQEITASDVVVNGDM